ncbi:MAG TPA: aldo/keto reductase [Verrucomicrobiota bacterium]|nr:aldo/keto reductase [Verrucomicrobiota bacterium]
MKYNPLGKTGLNVSRLSFGASALGGLYGKVDEAEGIRAVQTALELGINYFDVAPAYGGTLAETVLGKALKGVPRDRYYLSTKAGKYTQPGGYGEDTLDYSRARIRTSLEESARRLGTDYFDLIHLHDFEYQHRRHTERALSEGVQTLLELKEEGRLRNVSFGIYPMDLWHRIFSTLPADVGLVHNHYTLHDTRALELVPLAKQKGIGIINGSPFGSGLLSGREAPDWHPATEEDRRVFRSAARFCESRGVPISRLALQFSSQNPEFPTTLFSSSRPESVQRNVQWHEKPLDPELLAAVQHILTPVMNKQWDYDAGVDRLKANSHAAASSVAAAIPLGPRETHDSAPR